MTIEILRGKSAYIYRINPYNGRMIDRRLNRHNARWEGFRLCNDEQDARNKILKLEKKEVKP
jgi:hypothetical protein